MSAVTNLTGTFYISSIVGTYLTFTGTNSGTNLTNLTTFQYSGGPEQQWELAPGTGSSVSSPAYTVKNVKYQTYASYDATNNPISAVGQSSSPVNWFVNIANVSQTPIQYQFATDPLIGSTWHDYSGLASDNNPVHMWPCCDSNGWWKILAVSDGSASMGSLGPSSTSTMNSATASPQTGATGSSSNNTALTIGLSVGISVFFLVGFTVLYCKWRRRKAHPMGS
ncbi:hypothetical protein BU15DRAFT_67270 [Melanogaster broomeanus]|nr:hypothetical protein BU15DRAFT_67270 [Melanogaster broomeanus]